MEEINKFLTEAMGECWHAHTSVIEGTWGVKCDKCGIIVTPKLNNDFLTWEGFGKLWQWGIDQEWWDTFMLNNGRCNDTFEMFINENLIEPEAFAKAVVYYLQEK